MDHAAIVSQQVVMMLGKAGIKILPQAERSGLLFHVFSGPLKGGILRPILEIEELNAFIKKKVKRGHRLWFC